MAGYSGTALPKKLGIKAGQRVVALGAPSSFRATLGALPAGVSWIKRLAARADLIVFFTKDAATLRQRLPALAKSIAPNGSLWVAWPKKTSRIATDLGENEVRALGLAAGIVDNKVCAIDDTWSGLRFVWRLADRQP